MQFVVNNVISTQAHKLCLKPLSQFLEEVFLHYRISVFQTDEVHKLNSTSIKQNQCNKPLLLQMQMLRTHTYSSLLFVWLVLCVYESWLRQFLVSSPKDFTGTEETRSPAPAQPEDRAADSDLSDRLVSLFTLFTLCTFHLYILSYKKINKFTLPHCGTNKGNIHQFLFSSL